VVYQCQPWSEKHSPDRLLTAKSGRSDFSPNVLDKKRKE